MEINVFLRRWQRVLAAAVFIAGTLAFISAPGHCAAALQSYFGSVRVLKAGTQDWVKIDAAPIALFDGDEVKTGFLSRATIVFADGSRVDLSGNSAFSLDQTKPNLSLMTLAVGVLKAVVAHIPTRSFQVKTPTSVCAVRGTEFKIKVLSDGTTLVNLYKGLLAITDRRNQQILLHPNERTRVELKGLRMGALRMRSLSETERLARLNKFRQDMRREMSFDVSRGQIQAAAIKELRLADYQQGKTLIDVSGHVVRVEQYIIQPSPNQVKMVVLNERQNNSLNFFYYLGTFNTNLPHDISLALRELPGTPDTPPTYYLTGYHSVWSNGTDSLQEITTDGHPVNLNNNPSGDTGEAVSSYFNPATNSYVALAPGEAFYSTLFDNEGLYVDGALKSGWTGSNIQTYASGYGSYGPTAATNIDPITGATLTQNLPAVTTNATFPNPGQVNEVIYNSYSDGTFLAFNNYVINNQGVVASDSDFGSTAGTAYEQNLLNYNFEQVITASEFDGRSIDLVVAPKIFVEAGLIQ